MNKWSTWLIAALAGALILIPFTASAQGGLPPNDGWWSGIQVQNVQPTEWAIITGAGLVMANAVTPTPSATPPVFSYLAFQEDWRDSGSYLVPYGASLTFLPDDFTGMPFDFRGSVVINSTQPIKAILNLTNRPFKHYGIPTGRAGAQWQAEDFTQIARLRNEPDKKLYFPLVKGSYPELGNATSKSTTLFLQNAGLQPARFTVTYQCGGDPIPQDTIPVYPAQMIVVYPWDAIQGETPQPRLCSATVQSKSGDPQVPVIGVAAEHYHTESIPTVLQISRGFTSLDYDRKLYAPILKNAYPGGTLSDTSRTTGARVQNVGTSTLDVTANYRGVGGSCLNATAQETQSIDGGAAGTFNLPASMGANCLASGIFSADGDLAGMVNEAFLHPVVAPRGEQSATAYNMIPKRARTTELLVPLYKEVFGEKTSGLQVENTGDTNATIYVEFIEGDTRWRTVQQTAVPGSSLNYFLVANTPGVSTPSIWTSTPMPSNKNVSAVVYSDQPVVGIVAEMPYSTGNPNCRFRPTATPPPYACYDRQNYEAFNRPTATPTPIPTPTPTPMGNK